MYNGAGRKGELAIGFSPKTDTDKACLVVLRREGLLSGDANVLTTYYGKEAEQLYCKLIGVDHDE